MFSTNIKLETLSNFACDFDKDESNNAFEFLNEFWKTNQDNLNDGYLDFSLCCEHGLEYFGMVKLYDGVCLYEFPSGEIISYIENSTILNRDLWDIFLHFLNLEK